MNPFDPNGDGVESPLQDGVLIVRYMLSQPDANLESPLLIPPGSTRTSGGEIRGFLDQFRPLATSAMAPVQGVSSRSSFARATNTAAANGSLQVVTAMPDATNVGLGDPIEIGTIYTTDPINNAVQGLSLRLHFDSSKVAFDSVSSVLPQGLQGSAFVSNDTSNFDANSNTDKYVQVDWVDFGLNWPGVALPIGLFDAVFTAVGSGEAVFNYTAQFTATGFDLGPNGAVVVIGNAQPPEVTVISRLRTRDATPEIFGSVSDGTLSVTVGGRTYSAGDGHLTVNGTDWVLVVADTHALAEGFHDVQARAVDAAGNVGMDSSADELFIDFTPLGVTIDSLVTSDRTPTLTGDVHGNAMAVTVNGKAFTEMSGVVVAGTRWSLELSGDDALDVGVYDVEAVVVDVLNNAAADTTVDELRIVPSWQNAANPLDVNNDGVITALDALLVINFINVRGMGPIPVTPPVASPPPFIDPTGDNAVLPDDVLQIINHINDANDSSAGAEAERAVAEDVFFGMVRPGGFEGHLGLGAIGGAGAAPLDLVPAADRDAASEISYRWRVAAHDRVFDSHEADVAAECEDGLLDVLARGFVDDPGCDLSVSAPVKIV